jgi:hypothetical protein
MSDERTMLGILVFYRIYFTMKAIVPQLVAQLQGNLLADDSEVQP